MHRNQVYLLDSKSNIVIKNNFYLKMITLIFVLNFQRCCSYDLTIIMPYKKIYSSELNIIGNTIQCNETRFNIKTCAEECFEMENENENCVGLLKDGTDCFLCKVLDIDVVNSYLFTNITENQILYLLKYPENKPDVAISMDNFDLNTGIITGHRVSGGSNGITADDLIPGKVGQAIHFYSNRRIKPAVDQPECFCNFYYCNGKMSVSFWAKEVTIGSEHAITQENGLSVVLKHGKAGGGFRTHDVHLSGFGKSFNMKQIFALVDLSGHPRNKCFLDFSVILILVLPQLPHPRVEFLVLHVSGEISKFT